MLADIAREALTVLVSRGGFLGIISCLLIVCIVILWRKGEKDNATNDLDRNEHYETRIREFRIILDALNRSSDALGRQAASNDERNEATNRLVAQISDLVREIGGVQRKLEDIQRRIR